MTQRRACRTIAPLLALALVLVTGGLLALPALAAEAPARVQPAEPPSPPPAALPAEIGERVARLAAAIDAAERNIPQIAGLEEELGHLRVDVETILSESSQTAEALRPQLAAMRSQIERLGPPPAKDAPAEAEALSGERARLNARASALDGAIKSTQLTWVRARQLIEKITVLRHALFAKNLMQRLPSPLLPALWRELNNEAPAVGNRISYLTGDWIKWATPKSGAVILLIGAVVALFVILKGVAARLTRLRRAEPAPPPSFFARAIAVAWVAPLIALAPIAASLLLYGGLEAMDLLFPPWAGAADAVVKAVFVYACITALIYATLAPNEPHWRLLALADAPTRRIRWLLYAITALYVVDAAMTETSRVFFVPLAMSVVQAFAASSLFALLLIGLLLTPFTPQAASGTPTPRHHPRAIKLPLWLLAIAILGLALVGYVALARFIAQQMVMTGIVVVVGWLLYLAVRAVTRDTQRRRYAVGELLETRFGLDGPRRNQLARLTELALSFALIIAAIPFLMLQWGFSGADIRDGFKALLFGMQIGQFHISLARILIGIVLFIALLFATRLLQRWLRERALQQTRLDPGIVNSIDTVVGYSGTALAALFAVSYAGLDITNVAIVAGALSVGIGFGLQSIVNNFVSGLILLIERPIKLGDWIVLGSEQGNVRRISVRATEIETFDRASLIIPNSELITGRVLNWTHRNSMGRVILRIGVSYRCDPEEVMAILTACARAHPGVLAAPEPIAALENFGASALEFSLRAYLADIGQSLKVQSDLRVGMLKALRAANIEIPFNQVDVNVRGIDADGHARGETLKEQTVAADNERAPVANAKPIASAAE
jgi:small-conductance mechanosensitive channel